MLNLTNSHSFTIPNGKYLQFDSAEGLYAVNPYQSALLAQVATGQIYPVSNGNAVSNMRAAEWCAGNGPAAVAMKASGVGYVSALDVNQRALEVAKHNGNINGAPLDSTEVMDLAELKVSLNRRLDLIAVNPPCGPTSAVPKDASDDLKRAVNGGEGGIYYFRLAAEAAAKHLTENGRLVIVLTSTMDIPHAVQSLNDNFGHNWFAAPTTPILAPLPNTLASDPRGQQFLSDAQRGRTIAYPDGENVMRLTWIIVAGPNLHVTIPKEDRLPMHPYGQPTLPVNTGLMKAAERVSALLQRQGLKL